MPAPKKNFVTAVALTAVAFVAIVLTGCVTPRHIDEIKADIADVEAQTLETQRMVANIETTVASEAEASGRLRADMSMTVSQLSQQIHVLLENYNDLMEQLRQIQQKPQTIRVLKGSDGVSTQQPAMEPSFDCDQAYDQGFLKVFRKEYDQGIADLKTFIEKCPQHGSVENAYYWIGESYYALEKYPEAIEQLELLVNNFKSSPKLGRALYKLARCKEEMNQKSEAIKLYQQIVDDYSETLEASQAQDRIKELK